MLKSHLSEFGIARNLDSKVVVKNLKVVIKVSEHLYESFCFLTNILKQNEENFKINCHTTTGVFTIFKRLLLKFCKRHFSFRILNNFSQTLKEKVIKTKS